MSQYTILTEGPEDMHALVHLLRRYSIPLVEPGQIDSTKIAVENNGGIDRLLESLPIRIRVASSIEGSILGVVVDSDADAADLMPDGTTGLTRRWQTLRALLLKAGYTDVPMLPYPDGTILAEQDDVLPRIGVWLMPDNQIPGKLEHFVRLLVPGEDLLWDRADECIETIPGPMRRFAEKDRIKAHLHTWLAWQPEPGRPIGQAITKRFLSADAPMARSFVAWVRLLFDV